MDTVLIQSNSGIRAAQNGIGQINGSVGINQSPFLYPRFKQLILDKPDKRSLSVS